jgi:hypothetical protein
MQTGIRRVWGGARCRAIFARTFRFVTVSKRYSSEGAPGLRPQYNPDFYAAYVRDPDGNKLAAVCRGFTERQ